MSDRPPAWSDPAAEEAYVERHAALYDAHCYDAASMAYRRAFVYPALWGGLDLNGKRVAELACGAGHDSEALLAAFPRARIEGFDISPAACGRYTARVGAPAHEADLTQPLAEMAPFDAAIVVDGLNRCVADLPTVIRNVAGLLKPGGIFMMVEPSRGVLLEAVRRLAYRLDRPFADAHDATLDHDALLAIGAPWFQPRRVVHFGGPAYLAMLNSMILRIPLHWKPRLAPPLMAIERLWNRLPSRRLKNVFAAQWVRVA